MTAAGLFLVSAASLAFEVLLARLLAVSQWNHLAFLVLGTALFGGAAGGSSVSLRRRPPGRRPGDETLFQAALAGFAAAALLAFAALNGWLPLDYFKLPVDGRQWLYLGAAYLLAALPFFFAGVAASLAFAAAADQTGPVYFAAMTGSALGALAPLPLLAWLDESQALVLSALLPLPLVMAAAWGRLSTAHRSARRSGALLLTAAALSLTAGLGMLSPPAAPFRELRLSDYKALAHSRRIPGHQELETWHGLRGRLDLAAGAHLRFAPGLSLNFTGRLPSAQALFTDGDKPLFLYESDIGELAPFASATLSFAGYALRGRPERVLVLVSGGGLSIACALAAGAAEVTVVHPDPRAATLIGRHYGLDAVGESPRAFLAAAAGRYDLIHIENWGSSVPGAGALDQDHSLTVDAIRAALERLTPDGVLVVSRRLLLPPSDDLRLFAAAHAGLEAIGVARPQPCVAMLRNWNTVTLVAGRHPLPSPARLREFARRGGFDVLFLEGAEADEANRFHVFERPFHFETMAALSQAIAAGRSREFFDAYPLDVAPQGDRRPFPGRFLKWTRLDEIFTALGGRPEALFLSGEVVLAALFVESLVLALALLGIPAAAAARRRGRTPLPAVLYFGALGAGFMLVELFFIHAGAFFLGDAVTSMALVLASLLVAAGVSGRWSQRLGRRRLAAAVAAALAAPLLAGILLHLFRDPLLGLSAGWRTGLFFLAALLPGAALGLPFPMGMRHLLPRPQDRAFAWAVNGCAAVTAASAGAAIALALGLGWLLGVGALAYAAALPAALAASRSEDAAAA